MQLKQFIFVKHIINNISYDQTNKLQFDVIRIFGSKIVQHFLCKNKIIVKFIHYSLNILEYI